MVVDTVYTDSKKLNFDLNIFGQIVYHSQSDMETLRNLVYSEMREVRPIRDFNTQRGMLSPPTSKDYEIQYSEDMELSEGEIECDFEDVGDFEEYDVADILFEDDLNEIHEVTKRCIIQGDSSPLSLKQVTKINEAYRSFLDAEIPEFVGNLEELEQRVAFTKNKMESEGLDRLYSDFEEDISFEDSTADGEYDLDVGEDERDYQEKQIELVGGIRKKEFVGVISPLQKIANEKNSNEDYDYGEEEEYEDTEEEYDDNEEEYEDKDEEYDSTEEEYDNEEEEYADNEEEYENTDREYDYANEEYNYANEEYLDVEKEENETNVSQDIESKEGYEKKEIEVEKEVQEPSQALDINDIEDFEPEFEDINTTVVTPEFKSVEEHKERKEEIVQTEQKEETEVEEKKEEIQEDEPKDLLQFLRKHPKCEVEYALKYFSKREIEKNIMIGRIIKKNGKLYF